MLKSAESLNFSYGISLELPHVDLWEDYDIWWFELHWCLSKAHAYVAVWGQRKLNIMIDNWTELHKKNKQTLKLSFQVLEARLLENER